MSRLPTGTVTFVFTDIEGSTRLLQTLGDRYSAALAHHRALLRDAFTSFGGTEVDTQGDAFFVSFPTPQGALKAAVQAQRALAYHSWPEQIELRVRMGIHTGTPEVSEQGYVGSDVHLGARICAAAWGGQILVSPTTAAHLSSALDDVTLRSLGSHALKDIVERVELYQVVAPELRQNFPPPRTTGSHPTNLPPRLPPLIGRDTELATVTELLGREDVSLVTLVGPGGTGKTRLALATGAQLLISFPDGVFFVDLSALTDPSLVVPQIAQALSLRETPGRSLQDTLTDHLSAKHTLLILDNLEQVIDAATAIATLLTGAPDLKVLATSRESLRITGEKELPLAPLSLPRSSDPPEDIAASPAVQLFVARAKDVRPDFTLTPADALTVGEVCRRLDGLPLAIELAAARVKVLSLPALQERLEQGLKVLTSGRRDASERQRTLRGAIAWSYDLLSEEEQTLFRRLAVFAGGWSLEAAEQVCDQGLGIEVLDGLASLVDKSLVRTDEHRERFSMLETIREFASDRLEESGEGEEIRRAHAEFFRRLAAEAEPHLIGPGQKQWLDRVEQEHDHLRAALRWTLAKEPELARSIAAQLCRFWYVRGYLSEGRRWLELVLRCCVAVPTRDAVTVATMLGVFAYLQSDFDESRSVSLQGMALATEAGDERGVLRCTETLALCAMEQGEYAEARRHFEKILEGFHTLHDERGVATTIANLAALSMFEGDHYKASELANESLRHFRSLDDKEGMAGAFVVLGLNEIIVSDWMSAIPYLKEALDVAAHLRHPELIASALNGLAAAAVASGDAGRGAVLMGGANRVRTESGVALDPLEHRIQDDARIRMGQLLAETKLDEMFERGRVMTIGELVRCAASDRAPPSAY